MKGPAFDIAMSNHDPAAFEAVAREAGFLGFGFYPRSDFIHLDPRPEAERGMEHDVMERGVDVIKTVQDIGGVGLS